MRWLKWILTALPEVIALSAGAAPTLTPATSFYRSPESIFASGQTSRANLEKTRFRSEFILHQRVKWDGRQYLMSTDDLLRDAQVLRAGILRENSALLKEMRSDSAVVVQLTKNTETEILETRQHWARVRAKGGEGWIPLFRLDGRNDDPGVFVTLLETPLRASAHEESRLHTTIPRRVRLTALGYEDGWVRVAYRGTVGYVDAHHLVGRADFATWAWRRSADKWILVSHREGTNLRGKAGETIPLADVSAFTPNPRRAIVTQIGGENLPPLRAHGEILKTEATRWGVSRLDGHDEVWWRQNQVVLDEPAKTARGLSTEELLKRPVFSYALSGSKKIEGLVSAGGIWKTTDGHSWTKLENFGDQDLPVAVDAKNGWFVGNFRSTDKGATFENFIRWEALTKSIEGALSRPPKYVKLQKIEVLPASHVQVLVDTGVKRLSLKTSLAGNVWRIAR